MSDRRELPTEDDLKTLPLRAIVAYAVRCAKRVQPLYAGAAWLPGFAEHEAAVERAISLAQNFCLGQDVSAIDDAVAAAAAAEAAAWVAADAAKAAAFAAAYAAYAANAANAATYAADEAVDAAIAAADAEAEAYADDDLCADNTRVAARAAKTDIDRLLQLNLGTYPELGQRIDPTENGPLGLLWPEGPPEWYTA